MLAHVLLHRLNPLLAEHRRPQQSGFTAGRSTADAILALRLLVELHSEFKRPLYVGYVDLKSAFDSVNRTSLWLALKGIGVTGGWSFVYYRTCTRIRELVLGLAQMSQNGFIHHLVWDRGCVLAPALFCRAIDWIMSHMQGLAHVKVGDYQAHGPGLRRTTSLYLPFLQYRMSLLVWSLQNDGIKCLVA